MLLPHHQRFTKYCLSRFQSRQNAPDYDLKHFYLVKLGEIFHETYQVAAKLIQGASSTIWLANPSVRVRHQARDFYNNSAHAT
ncbi:hypothetical protein M405DRAFT_774426 [Rhizopogon salebrosus TDB-379]|nr:hypothetical protein M405DRAFT_774426 [Rhizopogon salebrosus TDB-379]